jgi:hypothetical protein
MSCFHARPPCWNLSNFFKLGPCLLSLHSYTHVKVSFWSIQLLVSHSTTTIWGRYYSYHFTDEESDIQDRLSDLSKFTQSCTAGNLMLGNSVCLSFTYFSVFLIADFLSFRFSPGSGFLIRKSWPVLELFIFSCENTREKQYIGGKIYFGLFFQRFQSMLDWLHCF